MLLKKGDRVIHCGAFHTEDPKVMRVTGIQKASFEVIEDELIDEIEWDAFKATPKEYVVDFQGGGWAYNYQIYKLGWSTSNGFV